MAEALRLAGESVAHYGGNYLTRSFTDLLNPEPEDARSCEEITAEIVARCGLEMRGADEFT